MRLKRSLVLVLVSIITISGCSRSIEDSMETTVEEVVETEIVETNESESVMKESEEVKTSVLINDGKVTFYSLKEKYDITNEDLGYSPLYNVDDKAKFTFHFNSLVDPFNAVTVHTDRECGLNSMIYTMNMAYFTEDGGIDVIVDKLYSSIIDVKDRLDYVEDLDTWGHAGKYYLSINYDMKSKTPIKLEEPIIIPFTLKNDVEIPILSSKISENGDFILTWNEIEGVDSYRIYKSCNFTDTQKKLDDDNLVDLDDSIPLNRKNGYVGLNIELLTEVEPNFTELNLNEFLDGSYYDSNGYCNIQNNFNLSDYYITAVRDGKESNFGLEVKSYLYGNKLPYSIDTLLLEIDEEGNYLELPETYPVKMKDDSIVQMPVNFTLKSDKNVDNGVVTYKYEVIGSNLTGEIEYKISESGLYPQEKVSTAELDSTINELKIDLSLLSDITFPVINNGKEIELDLTNLKVYNPNSRVVYNQDAIYERTDLEVARINTNGIYSRDPFEIEVVDYNDRQNDLNEREKNLGDIFSVNSLDNDIEDLEEVELNVGDISDFYYIITSDNIIQEKIESDNQKKSILDDLELSIDNNYSVYADSIEEEYLAISLINNEERIRLDFLPKLMDAEILFNTLSNVYFKNPDILCFEYANLEQSIDGSLYLVIKYNNIDEELSELE